MGDKVYGRGKQTKQVTSDRSAAMTSTAGYQNILIAEQGGTAPLGPCDCSLRRRGREEGNLVVLSEAFDLRKGFPRKLPPALR